MNIPRLSILTGLALLSVMLTSCVVDPGYYGPPRRVYHNHSSWGHPNYKSHGHHYRSSHSRRNHGHHHRW